MPTAAAIGHGRAEVRAHDWASARAPWQDVNFACRRLLLRIGRVLLPGLRSALRQPDRRRGGASFSAPGDSGSLDGHAGWNQRVALLCRRRTADDRGPIVPVLQRFGVTIEGTPPAKARRSAPTALSAVAGDASATLSWTAPSLTEARPSRATRSIATRAQPDDGGRHGRRADELSRLGARERHHLLLQGVRAQRQRREPALQPGLDDPVRARRAGRSAADRRCLRPHENPLCDAGRWTNGINGSVETGLYTTANQVACTKTSTCTAWRNAAEYGPDVEVWARLSTFPERTTSCACSHASSSRAPRLRRLHAAPNQLAGTDQILFERVDNGAFVNLLTVNEQLPPATPSSCASRARPSRPGATTARPGHAWSDLRLHVRGHRRRRVGMRGTTGRATSSGPGRRARTRPVLRPPSPPSPAMRARRSPGPHRASTEARLLGLQGLSQHEREPDDGGRHGRRADDYPDWGS